MRTRRQLHRLGARRGRLLVECAVGLLLLAVGAIAVATATRSVALLADDAVLVARARAQAVTAAESLLALPCAASSAVTDRDRVQLAVTGTRSASLHTTLARATPRATPLAARTIGALTLSAAGRCQ